MNHTRKNINVRFFSVQAHNNYFRDLISVCNINQANNHSIRIVNIRKKKFFIKIHQEIECQNDKIYFISIVRERNTWQTVALRNGNISGIPINQGVIGDPYYFAILPTRKIVLGFTTGLSGTLKSVAATILQQFNKDRLSKINIEPLYRSNEFSKIRSLKGYNKLHFKVDTSFITDNISEDTPSILKELSTAPFMVRNSVVAITFTEIGENGFSERDLIDIVDYLSENEGCSALTVQGLSDDGMKVHLDFSKAYVMYKTQLEIRGRFVEEKVAKDILIQAIGILDSHKLK